MDGFFGWAGRARPCVEKAMACARRAVELDADNPVAHENLGHVYMVTGAQQEAIAEQRRAIELEPNSCTAYAYLGAALALAGYSEEAIDAVNRAERGSPRDPFIWIWRTAKCVAHFVAGRYEDALQVAREVRALKPSWYASYVFIAACAALVGQSNEARAAVRDLLALIPHFSVRGMIKNPELSRQADRDRLVDGLRKAGLPE
jgi:tetratricopeptide (TPR) repeat protein